MTRRALVRLVLAATGLAALTVPVLVVAQVPGAELVGGGVGGLLGSLVGGAVGGYMAGTRKVDAEWQAKAREVAEAVILRHEVSCPLRLTHGAQLPGAQ